MMTYRERQPSGKAHFKEKVSQIYENLFASRDISEGRIQFWDEFLLLRVNMKTFLSHFDELNFEKLTCLSNQLQQVFLKCAQVIEAKKSHIRMANAIQTASCLIEGVFNCVRPKSSPLTKENGPNCGKLDQSQLAILIIITGRENPEYIFANFVQAATSILIEPLPHRLKCLVLKLFLTVASVSHDIEKNFLLPFLYSDSLYDWLIHTLCTPDSHKTFDTDVVNLLALLLHYHTDKVDNSFRTKFQTESNEVIFQEYSAFAIKELLDFIEYFRKNIAESQGFLSSLSSIIGSALVGGEKPVECIKSPDCSLFCLYVGMHCHQDFILSLIDTTHSSSKSTSPDIHTIDKTMSLSDPSVEQQIQQLSPTAETSLKHSANVMILLMEYTSIAMQDVKDSSRRDACRLCLTIFLLICECDAAISILHDTQVNFKVNLHKMQMRHRKSHKMPCLNARPLACSLLDLIVEYISCHLMKPLPVESYCLCLSLIQRLVCYQKRLKIRITYDWKPLWSALFNLMRYLLSVEHQEVKSLTSVIDLLHQVVRIFNLFITFGDSFMASTNTYDDLYYELIRMCGVFESTYTLTLRHGASNETEIKSKSIQLSSQLENIRAIIGHFSPKIEAWAIENRQTSLSHHEVMEVITANYSTLTLKLLHDLDKLNIFDKNIGQEKEFFRHLVESIMLTIRSDTLESNLCHQQYFHELSLLSTEQAVLPSE